MMCVVNVVLPSPSSRVLSGDGLVGANPTMNTNTPRLRRGGGDSFFKFSFVTQLPSWSVGLYFLFGVFLP